MFPSIFHIIILLSFIFPQSEINDMIEIETNDGNIFLGELIQVTEEYYRIKTKDSIEINVPKTSVKTIENQLKSCDTA